MIAEIPKKEWLNLMSNKGKRRIAVVRSINPHILRSKLPIPSEPKIQQPLKIHLIGKLKN